MVVEGIFGSAHYGAMLRQLNQDHQGASVFCYFAVSWSETLRRHASRAQSREFGIAEMQRWWCEHDVLNLAGEQLITETARLNVTVQHLLDTVFTDVPGSAP